MFARQHAGIGAGECGVEALIGLNDRPSGSQMKGSEGVLRGPGSRGSYDTLQDGARARLVTMAALANRERRYRAVAESPCL